jgi:hypothetical protein
MLELGVRAGPTLLLDFGCDMKIELPMEIKKELGK